MIKGPIHPEDIILNLYSINTSDSKYMKQNWIDLKEKIDKSIYTDQQFNNPFSLINKSSRLTTLNVSKF